MSEFIMTAIGISSIFFATTLGAALTLYFGAKTEGGLLTGIASGVMVAASVFSLLIPAFDGLSFMGAWRLLPIIGAFMAGGVIFYIIERLFSAFAERGGAGGDALIKAKKKFIAITVHNVPEGLAVGFAFGSAAALGRAGYIAALFLSLGIAVQNFPEGAAVAVPLNGAGLGRKKAFLYGVASGIVEPVAAVFGLIFSSMLNLALPVIMAFAAGTMIFVVIEDMSPEEKEERFAAWGFMIGFAIMMALDVAFGG